MPERRTGARHPISFPIRVEWTDDTGREVVEEGLTENVGMRGALVHLPRHLPVVGSRVNLTVTEDSRNEVKVLAQVLRLERNAAHPQVALMLIDETADWEKRVWEYAGRLIATQKPDEHDDWN